MSQIIVSDVGSKCDDSDAKAWENALEHLAVCKNGTFPPSLTLCPRVAVELSDRARRVHFWIVVVWNLV